MNIFEWHKLIEQTSEVGDAKAVDEELAPLSYKLDPDRGMIQTGTIGISQLYEPAYIADTGNKRIVETAGFTAAAALRQNPIQ